MKKDSLFLSGIFLEGYGMIAKSVMKDKRLSIEAKAIYSYLVSYSGAGLSSFPSTELILGELKISHKRYLSHRKQLENLGYINIKRERTDNGFSKNLYEIVTDVSVHGRFVHEQTVHEHSVSEQNVGTISNSSKSNNFKSNSKDKPIVENDYKSIIEYLNKKANKNYRNVDGNTKYIKARYNEGYELEDFYKVIDNMTSKWLDHSWKDKQGNIVQGITYLRPETLFGNKFDSYLNQEVTEQKEEIHINIERYE